MSPAKSLDCATPLLEAAPTNDHHGEEETRKGWWKKVMDVEEAKNQVLFSLPMIVTNVCYYAIPLVSVMFAGHLGQLELAGASLANSWATVTGFTFMSNISLSHANAAARGELVATSNSSHPNAATRDIFKDVDMQPHSISDGHTSHDYC
ncbi:hypothetical protein Patl1_04696 [Pistacia atlantica]|uniref:Uncharacterized protein n=1 Tax=Pistacia atlantica TaxID=434234 RepID=A0ACC1BVS6_9ROSI|nr:hypothetical protein Patl1_04696 [Pistacia atlantica]